jgi:predicted RNA binding protein YcfA (HicA-like mRNA interferase family)
VPKKLRELIAALRKAGFKELQGKGSHRKHPNVVKPITISGKVGKDAQPYQEDLVQEAIEEAGK